MRRTFAALAFTAVLASGAATFALMPNGGEVIAAPTSATFVVPAHDGYGIAECLASNSECAKVVADGRSCCGLTLLSTGQLDAAARSLEEMLERLGQARSNPTSLSASRES